MWFYHTLMCDEYCALNVPRGEKSQCMLLRWDSNPQLLHFRADILTTRPPSVHGDEKPVPKQIMILYPGCNYYIIHKYLRQFMHSYWSRAVTWPGFTRLIKTWLEACVLCHIMQSAQYAHQSAYQQLFTRRPCLERNHFYVWTEKIWFFLFYRKSIYEWE